MMMIAEKPLLLKDFLELDPNSDSCNSFHSFPRKPNSTTVRFLLQAEQCKGVRLIRSRSKNALTKLASIINSVNKLHFPTCSPTRPSNIAKKLSRKFRKCKKKYDDQDGKVTVKDIVRLNSFDLYGQRLCYPSPIVSSCSSTCSEGEECSESFVSISSGSSECFGDGRRSDLSVQKSPISDEPKSSLEKKEVDNECRGCHSEEEKEQLSPVSIMDFPQDEEENESPYFEQSLANMERTTHQLLQKIRLFESLADLDPLNLQFHFTSSDVAEDEEDDSSHGASSNESIAWNLIQRLQIDHQLNPQLEEIIFDFFIDCLSCSDDSSNAKIERLILVAENWINGGGFLKGEEHGKDQLAEMEKNGRWRCFEDGRDDVAADVEHRVMGSLLHELVMELSDGLAC